MNGDALRLELALRALLTTEPGLGQPQSRLARRLWRGQQQPFFTLTLEGEGGADEPDVPEGMAYIDAREVIVHGRLYPLGGFALDRTPVTNTQWKRFVEATGEAPPPYWLGDHPAAHLHDHPVVGIPLEQAQAYAAWRGVRLPTTLEWIAAAQGEWSGQRFPWGDSCDRTKCNCPLLNPRETTPAHAFPAGASPEGVMDLYGNTWEWTERDARLPSDPEGRVWVLGGSFDMPCVAHKQTPMRALSPEHDALNLGFRCAADLPGAA